MKRIMFFALILSFLMMGKSVPVHAEEGSGTEIVIGADLHYLSPLLTDCGEMFQKVLANGDGKLTWYSEELTSAFLDDVISRHPAALVLPGDLTFNGAQQSHLDLAEKLWNVQAEGIPVYVIPGNHDVYNRNAAKFSGNTFERLPITTSEVFRSIYSAFGYEQAIAEDEDSLSYIVPLNDSTVFLMLDFNTAHDACGISAKSLRWMDQQLQSLQSEGKRVIAVGHQNLFRHSMFDSGYIIRKTTEVRRIFEAYGIDLYLSAHMHIQHIREQKGITEIVTTALCLYPCRYGILTLSDEKDVYGTKEVDVSSWARRTGDNREELLSFADYAQSMFDNRSRLQAAAALSESNLSEEEKLSLINYAAAVQRGVFSGDLRPIADLDPDNDLARAWYDIGNMHGTYLSTAAADRGCDFNFWERPVE